MAEKITLEVGDLYANIHDGYSNELDEQYDEALRQEVEDFIHNFNQQVERQQESMQAGNDINLDE